MTSRPPTKREAPILPGGRCDRCDAETPSTIMSMFNTQALCRACEERERRHPMFEDARAAELAAVRRGDYNFPGVGLPKDLDRAGYFSQPVDAIRVAKRGEDEEE